MCHSLKKRDYAWDFCGELMLLIHYVTLSHIHSSFILLFSEDVFFRLPVRFLNCRINSILMNILTWWLSRNQLFIFLLAKSSIHTL